MITISSKAGQRLAKAKVAEKAAFDAWLDCEDESKKMELFDDHMRAMSVLDETVTALTDELIANGHHMTEGD